MSLTIGDVDDFNRRPRARSLQKPSLRRGSVPQPDTRAVDWEQLALPMMTPVSGTVSLITPSYREDLERSVLLFDSIDRHVRSFERHYVIVHDDDLSLFKSFHRGRRVVLPASDFLPRWLRQVPRLRWRNRQYWWSLKARPVSGWHTQQLVKIEAAARLPEDRFCLIDSDNVFFRDFDVATLANPNILPVHVYRNGAGEHRPRHLKWVQTAHQLLGLEAPSFPADDYIDQIIVWDKAIINAMTARIEALSHRDWAETLCRVRNFSEYMIYGTFITREASLVDRYRVTTDSFCRTYWDDDALRERDIAAMLKSAAPHEVALCVQSFNPTPLSVISRALRAFEASPIEAPRLKSA